MPVAHPMPDLDATLRARGLRATPQRRLVLEAVRDLGHATPEQVCEAVQRRAPAVSLSTVYRTLELLEDLGAVSHAHLRHGAPSFHLAEHADHFHLVCRRCGGIAEADLAQAAPLVAEVQRAYGFSTDVSHLSLHGLCTGCAAAGS
jgi:Fur family transcriptional regulator, ferric uptake regulator